MDVHTWSAVKLLPSAFSRFLLFALHRFRFLSLSLKHTHTHTGIHIRTHSVKLKFFSLSWFNCFGRRAVPWSRDRPLCFITMIDFRRWQKNDFNRGITTIENVNRNALGGRDCKCPLVCPLSPNSSTVRTLSPGLRAPSNGLSDNNQRRKVQKEISK